MFEFELKTVFSKYKLVIGLVGISYCPSEASVTVSTAPVPTVLPLIKPPLKVTVLLLAGNWI